MAPPAPMQKGMALTTVKAIVFSLGGATHKDHHVKNIKSNLYQICCPECLELILYCSHCFQKANHSLEFHTFSCPFSSRVYQLWATVSVARQHA